MLSTIILLVLQAFSFTLIARAILSWLNIGPSSSIYPIWNLVVRITEPILAPVRRALPAMGGLDLSILLVIIGINAIGVPLAAAL